MRKRREEIIRKQIVHRRVIAAGARSARNANESHDRVRKLWAALGFFDSRFGAVLRQAAVSERFRARCDRCAGK